MARMADIISTFRKRPTLIDDELPQMEDPNAEARFNQLISAMSRGPAAEIGTEPKPEMTTMQESTVKTPMVEAPEARVRSRMQELQQMVPGLQQQVEERRTQKEQELLSKMPKAEIPAFQASPQTQQQIDEIRRAGESMLQEKPEIEKPNYLVEAAVTFGPAIAGILAGVFSKDPVLLPGSIAAGAEAGVGTLARMKDEQRKLYERELDRLKERNRIIGILTKKSMDAKLQPEQLMYKAQIEETARDAARRAETLKTLAQEAMKNDPVNKQLEAVQKQIADQESQLARVLGQTGEKVSKVGGKVVTGKPGKASDIERAARAEDDLGFGFKADKKRAPPTAAQQKQAAELVGGFGRLSSSIDNALQLFKDGVFNLPYSRLREEQKQAIGQVFVQMKNSAVEGNFGAALSEGERKIAREIVPDNLDADQLVKHLFDSKSLKNRLIQLQSASKKRVLSSIYPLHYTYSPTKGESETPTIPETKSKTTPPGPGSVGSLSSEERKKRIEALRKRLGK